MPLVLPERIDREDQEKFVRLIKGDPTLKVDRQDYSPVVARSLPNEGYINDEDVVSKMKEAAALVP